MFLKKKFGFIVTNDDYVVRDHQLYGKRMMPGVVFLDVVFRYVKSNGYDVSKLELKNVVFKEPIVTSEHLDRKVQVFIYEDDDHYFINAQSIEFSNGKVCGNEWHDNFEAELHECNETSECRIDIESLEQGANEIKDMDSCYEFCRKVGLVHYDFMKLLGKVYIANDYILAKVWLSDLGESVRTDFLMHPAFLDGSLSVPGALGIDQEDIDVASRRPYIPMFIGRFNVRRGLPKICYVYIDKKNVRTDQIALTQKRDINYYNVEIFDENGIRVVFYEKFGVKMVRNQETIDKLSVEKKSDETLNEKSDITEDNNESDINAESGITNTILRMVADTIKCKPEEIDQDLDYYDLGLDSKDLLDIVKMIEKKIGQKLYPTLLFEYSTIKQLSDYLEETYGNRLENEKKHKNLDKSCDSVFYAPYWRKRKLKHSKGKKEKALFIYYLDDALGNWIKNKSIFQEMKHVALCDDIDDKKIIQSMIDESTDIENIYFVAKTSDFIGTENCEKMINAENNGILTLFNIVSQLINKKLIRKIRKLAVITDNCFKIDESSSSFSFSNAIFGFLRTLSIEYPKTEVISIDLNKNELFVLSDNEQQNIYNNIVTVNSTFPFHEFAIRKEFLYEKKIGVLEEYNLKTSKFVQNGTYLIVGGAGGIGFELCKYLVNNYNANVVITGRSELNGQKKRMIDEISKNVLYLRADVTNISDMQIVRNRVHDLFGRVNGVVHSAVSLHDGLIDKMTVDSLQNVLAPKCIGSVVLYDVFSPDIPDFFLFFSSTQSLFSSYGQGNYTAACSFEDGYAESADLLSKSDIKVINWGYWGSVGIAARNADSRENLEIGGAISITPEEGMRYIETVLSEKSDHVIVVKAKEQVLLGSGVDVDQKIPKSNCIIEADEKELDDMKRNYEVQKSYTESDLFKNNESSLNGRFLNEYSEKIKLIGMGEKNSLDYFKDFWYNFKHEKYLPIGNENLSEEFLKRSSKKDKILHLIFNTENTGKMEVITSGDGRPVLFIDGFGLTASQWYYQFKELNSDYQLIAVHIPGVGLSEGKNNDVSLRTIADQFVAVLDLLSIKSKVTIITSSWGGLIGQIMSVKYPYKVNALIMSGGFARFNSKEVHFRDVIKRDFENIHAMTHYDLIRKSEYLNSVSLNYSDYFSTEDIVNDIKVPTLIIYGEQDMVVDQKLTLQLIDRIPNAEVYPISNAGHVPNITHYKLFNEKVVDFIKRH